MTPEVQIALITSAAGVIVSVINAAFVSKPLTKIAKTMERLERRVISLAEHQGVTFDDDDRVMPVPAPGADYAKAKA